MTLWHRATLPLSRGFMGWLLLASIGTPSPIHNVAVSPLYLVGNNERPNSVIVAPILLGTSENASLSPPTDPIKGNRLVANVGSDKAAASTLTVAATNATANLSASSKESPLVPEIPTSQFSSTSLNEQRGKEAILRIIAPQSNGKSFFDTPPTGLGSVGQSDKILPDDTSFGSDAKPLSEKPIVNISAKETGKEGKTVATAGRPVEAASNRTETSSLTDKSKPKPELVQNKTETEQNPLKTPQNNTVALGNKNEKSNSQADASVKESEAQGKSTASRGNELPEKNTDSQKALKKELKSNQNDSKSEKVESKGSTGEENLLGKEVKPLLAKPTVSASAASTENTAESASVLFATGTGSEDLPIEAPKDNTSQDPKTREKDVKVSATEASKKAALKESKQAEKQVIQELPKVYSAVSTEQNLNSNGLNLSSPPQTARKNSGVYTEDKDSDASHKLAPARPSNTSNVLKSASQHSEANSTTGSVVSGTSDTNSSAKNSSSTLVFIGLGAVGFILAVTSVIIFGRFKKRKERDLTGRPNVLRDKGDHFAEYEGSEGAKEIPVPPPGSASLNDRTGGPIEISLPISSHLHSRESVERQMWEGGFRISQASSQQFSRSPHSTTYRNREYAEDRDLFESDLYEGPGINDREFEDNSRYRRSGGAQGRGRLDSFPSQRSTGRKSPQSEKGRFPYSRR